MNILNKPSFLSHILNGIIILLVIYLIYKEYDTIKQSSTMQILLLLILLSIAIGIHGLSHLGLEIFYKFNLLELV